GHLFGEKFMHAAKMQAKHVPFRGAPEAITELIAGRIDIYPGAIPNLGELVGDHQINVLAVATGRRSSLFPAIPTTVEAGYPESGYDFWMGAYMPAQVPVTILKRLNSEVLEVLKDADIQAKIRLLGGEIEPMSLDEFNAFLARER